MAGRRHYAAIANQRYLSITVVEVLTRNDCGRLRQPHVGSELDGAGLSLQKQREGAAKSKRL